MRKMPSLFVREQGVQQFLATQEVTPGCEWVIAGEGVPTRKWDGTCCLVRDGKLWKRLHWKPERHAGSDEPPVGWVHHSFDPNVRSGHGWIPVGDGPEDWMHRRAHVYSDCRSISELEPGTYELVGQRVNNNPEHIREDGFFLVKHFAPIVDFPRTFESVRGFLEQYVIEGIVWHHPDGRMVKIKRIDFGLPWPDIRSTAYWCSHFEVLA